MTNSISNPKFIKKYYEKFGEKPDYYTSAPGRVNLIGEHVDYNQGPVIPVGIDLRAEMVFSLSKGSVSTIYAGNYGELCQFDHCDLPEKVDVHGYPLPHWALYPAGIAYSFIKQGFKIKGIKAVINSEIPIGVGLGSSGAVGAVYSSAFRQTGEVEIDDFELARLCQRAEKEYVGVECGLMDQAVSFLSQEGSVLYLDTKDYHYELLPFDKSISIMVANTHVKRRLKATEYNLRRKSCLSALAHLQEYLPNLESLRDIQPNEFIAYIELLPEEEGKRAEHVIKEIARVFSARRAIERKDNRSLGALMFSSHKSLKELYEVSTPELDILVELARKAPGIIGAKLTGAGFGGCTVNLVDRDEAQNFQEFLSEEFKKLTGKTITLYNCKTADGAELIRLNPRDINNEF